jgi:hypothetical protein
MQSSSLWCLKTSPFILQSPFAKMITLVLFGKTSLSYNSPCLLNGTSSLTASALQKGLEYGSLIDVKIDNMRKQCEARWETTTGTVYE